MKHKGTQGTRRNNKKVNKELYNENQKSYYDVGYLHTDTQNELFHVGLEKGNDMLAAASSRWLFLFIEM